MAVIDDLTILSDKINAAGACDLEPWVAQFRDLVDCQIHIALANQIFTALLAGDHTAVPSTNGKFILLFNDRRVSLAIVRYNRPTKDILWSSENFVQCSISRNECNLRQFALPPAVCEELFDTEVMLHQIDFHRICFGGVVIKRPESVVDLSDLNDGSVDFVRLSLPPSGNFEWAFSRKTRRATELTTSRFGESNLLGILDLLAQAGNARSEDLLAHLAGHPLHFLRWRAIRSLVQLNRNRGIEWLRVAASDPHPDVRLAAGKSLEIVNSRLQVDKLVSAS